MRFCEAKLLTVLSKAQNAKSGKFIFRLFPPYVPEQFKYNTTNYKNPDNLSKNAELSFTETSYYRLQKKCSKTGRKRSRGKPSDLVISVARKATKMSKYVSAYLLIFRQAEAVNLCAAFYLHSCGRKAFVNKIFNFVRIYAEND